MRLEFLRRQFQREIHRGFWVRRRCSCRKWHRQVSLLGVESINKMKSLKGDKLDTGKFAENLTTEGIILYELPVGTRLKIGETIQEVTQIGKECHTGCNIRQLVGDCVMPREGIFTKVIKGGIIKAGDEIEIISNNL